MGDINSIFGVVRILEIPRKKRILKNIFVTELRVQFPQVRKNKTGIISLVLWDSLAQEIIKYYKVNDYILIKGYLSIRNSKIHFTNKKLKNIQITVLKIYPFKLNSSDFKLSISN